MGPLARGHHQKNIGLQHAINERKVPPERSASQNARKKIQLVEEQLQRDPTNEQVRDILSESQGKMTKVFQASIEHNSHISMAKWFKYGDTYSKTIFHFHQIGKKKTLLNELEVDGGTISNHRDLSHYITKFYVNLYASEAHAPGTSKAQKDGGRASPPLSRRP